DSRQHEWHRGETHSRGKRPAPAECQDRTGNDGSDRPPVPDLVRSGPMQPTVGQTLPDRGLYAGQLGIKLVLEVGEADFTRAPTEDSAQHPLLVGGECAGTLWWLRSMKNEVGPRPETEEGLLLSLLDPEVTTNRKIDNRRSD